MELNQEFSDMNLNLFKLKGLSFSQTLINHDKSLRQIISSGAKKISRLPADSAKKCFTQQPETTLVGPCFH